MTCWSLAIPGYASTEGAVMNRTDLLWLAAGMVPVLAVLACLLRPPRWMLARITRCYSAEGDLCRGDQVTR